MRTTDGRIVLVVGDDGIPQEWVYKPAKDSLYRAISGYGTPGWCYDVWKDATPDITDPTALGCICSLVGNWTDDLKSIILALESAP